MPKNKVVFIYLVLCGLFFCTIVLVSCYKTVIENNVRTIDKYPVTASLSGTNEPQPVVSDAAGSLAGNFDESTNTLAFSVSWSNLSNVVQGIEIQTGSDAPIAVSGFSYSRNGSLYSSVSLPPTASDNLLNGNYFINIKTAIYPAGEISGQMIAK